ncbi:MAG: sugar transferase [Bacteroidales bacterium]|nr:sugar transferase [Bacteroidales bacterium]
MKRLFDILFSFSAIVFLLPVYFVISLFIVFDSKGGVFYKQMRVGKNNMDFGLFKFRTMRKDAHKQGLLTVGGRDPRITNVGYFLRKYKLDELPQFINILNGDMSFVGPRPEVRKYVEMYSKEQMLVLSVKPGLTDYASIEYMDENDLLAQAADPEKAYIEDIMPAKLLHNMRYIKDQCFITDMKIIFHTLSKILSR